MTAADAERWDARYADQPLADARRPDALTDELATRLPSGGRALDVACGAGGQSLWLAEHGLDLFSDHKELDPEGDGLSNLMEFAFGGNPMVADSRQRGVTATTATTAENDGTRFLKLGFYRRNDGSNLRFMLRESLDMQDWTELAIPQRQIGPAVNMGDGTEYVEVLGSLPVNGPAAPAGGFLKLEVTPQ